MFLLDVKNLKVIKDPDLRERHLGDVQGLLFREAAKVCPQAYRAFSSRRTGQVIPVSFWHLFNQLLLDMDTDLLELVFTMFAGR